MDKEKRYSQRFGLRFGRDSIYIFFKGSLYLNYVQSAELLFFLNILFCYRGYRGATKDDNLSQL